MIIDNDEIISIMVNEEDHLRMQVMKSGFDLLDAWEIMNRIDDQLSKELNFAFSADLGYLTARLHQYRYRHARFGDAAFAGPGNGQDY